MKTNLISILLILSTFSITTGVQAARGGVGVGIDRGGLNNNFNNIGPRDNNDFNNGYNYRHDDDVVNNPVVIDANDGDSCDTTQVCNSYGQCTTQQDCD